MWTSEVFSMNIRAQAVGMCSQMQNVANTVFQQFFPTFLRNEGLRCLYFFMAINVCLFVFVWFFIPETKQIALEEIDVLFGGSSHAEKGTDMLGNHPHTTDDIRATNDAAFEVKDGATVQQTEAKKQSV
jgi:sugar transport protein